MVHSQNPGESCVICSSIADLPVLSRAPPEPEVRPGGLPGSRDAVGPVSPSGSSGPEGSGAFPLPGSCQRDVVVFRAFVSVLPVAGDPVKRLLEKVRGQRWPGRVKEVRSGSQPGQGFC